ncbi:histidine phosphatase family protein [Roseivirga sp. E12]|uniref:SixA phosphatase family protein n=1 Tax=Roseivirga sp. E12 TaxID=2819237 RepID=UPI001ABD3ED2|nr:histidine phosphatase family protein [Roseivirga sp. E12]MBO3699037.1 histidine phosphatase family protein [Roseivirga sp. E12]
MKRLFIVRHAKSSWDSPYLSDFDRPLNNRGKRDLPDMAKRFLETGYQVDLIIASPAERAWTTAKGFAETLSIADEKFLDDERFYHAGTSTLKEVISVVDDSVDNLMIFGHNPGLTSLIGDLSDFNLYNLPTCAACGIAFNIGSWQQILNTQGEKFYYDFPKSRA